MTSKLKDWSTTAASNNSAAPNGWPEGMAPSDVNNTARQDRASIREWYEDQDFIGLGHTLVSNTSTAIKVSGDQTAHYTAGRAIQINGNSAYRGYVSASAYSAPDTSITVSGVSLTTATSVEVGGIKAWAALPGSEPTFSAATVTGTLTAASVAGSAVAVQADMETATSTTKVVTPGGMKYHPGIIKAAARITWAAGSGAKAASITSGFGFSNATFTATGILQLTMSSTISSAGAVIPVASAGEDGANSQQMLVLDTAASTGSVLVYAFTSGASPSSQAGYGFVHVLGDF